GKYPILFLQDVVNLSRDTPSISMTPSSGLISPNIRSMIVVLPLPDDPTKAIDFPKPNSNETSLTALRVEFGYLNEIFFKVSDFGVSGISMLDAISFSTTLSGEKASLISRMTALAMGNVVFACVIIAWNRVIDGAKRN